MKGYVETEVNIEDLKVGDRITWLNQRLNEWKKGKIKKINPDVGIIGHSDYGVAFCIHAPYEDRQIKKLVKKPAIKLTNA